MLSDEVEYRMLTGSSTPLLGCSALLDLCRLLYLWSPMRYFSLLSLPDIPLFVLTVTGSLLLYVTVFMVFQLFGVNKHLTLT
jgi:hypothetical protein